MHEDLEHLVALDRLDRALEQTDKAIEGTRADLTEASEALEAAKLHLDDLQARLSTSRDEQHAGERQAKRYRDRKKSAESVLEGGVGDYDAAVRQITECNRILDDLETTILEQLELQDDLVAKMRAAEAGIVDANESLVLQRDLTPSTIEAQKALRVTLEAERKPHAEALPRDMLDRYTRVCARKRRAVSPVRHDACAACMQTVKPQERIELKRGRLLECGSCHRWLYLEPEGSR